MMIGLVGAPNKGKSTIFSALTMLNVAIADYPFTTIKPNLGVTYAIKACVETELGVRCRPRNGLCVDGIRQIPVNVVDIAGLVPGASAGKGMGNQFLNDLSAADVIIQVIDASGKTDISGNAAPGSDPAEEVAMLFDEMALWLSGIVLRHVSSLSKRADGVHALKEVLSSFNASEEQIGFAIKSANLSDAYISWDAGAASRFSREFIKTNKPIIVAANKLDVCQPGALDAIKKKLAGYTLVGCSGAIELALRKAAKSGAIGYRSGDKTINVKEGLSAEQRSAVEYMKAYLEKNGGTGIQELINTAVFGVARKIVVYPVENENKYMDHFGNVLPDALLLNNGSTAIDLAAAIHTDIAKHMLYAVDARTKNRLGKDYALEDNDVISIVSAVR